MAKPANFEGSNKIFTAPEGMDNCGDLNVFQTDEEIISCWILSKEELDKIKSTGVIWLSVSGKGTPPVYVSGLPLVQMHDESGSRNPKIFLDE